MLANLMLALLVQAGSTTVVINEFSYDDSSTDDREFVELFNSSYAPVDISNWVLDSADPFGPNTTYTIPPSTVLAPRSYYVLGSANVPNVDQVVGATNLWENGQDSLVLLDASGTIVDAVVYETNKGLWAGSREEGEGVWGNFTSIDGHETSWSRIRDGYDSDNNRDFHIAPSSPGAANWSSSSSPPVTMPFGADGGAFAPGDVNPAFGVSFYEVKAIDPLVQGPPDAGGRDINPNALPADSSSAGGSGGNAFICWDPSGGGDMAMLLAPGVGDVTLECLMYFDAAPEPTGEMETWSFGVQGGTGTFYNTPDPGGTLGFTANGNTGIAWTYQVSDSSAVLYLIDHNDGGWGANAKTAPTVLGSINITAGSNDGWQRLYLDISGSQISAEFGGTLGTPGSGSPISGTASAPALGGIYIGYREALGTNSTARPPTFDDLSISAPGYPMSTIGAAAATTAGTPALRTSGVPQPGAINFAILASGLVPSQSSILILGDTLLNPPFSMSLAGGQANSFLYIVPGAFISLGSDSNGDANVPLPIPPQSIFIGGSLYWQVFDLDPGLGIALPIGNSSALQTVIVP